MKTIVFSLIAIHCINSYARDLVILNALDPVDIYLNYEVKDDYYLGDRHIMVVSESFAFSNEIIADYVVEDYLLSAPVERETSMPNDINYAWHVESLDYSGLEYFPKGEGVVVAVIDTGVDYTHTALEQKIWVNQGEIAGNGIDDDGNGYIDDIHGYDFYNNDADPMDDNRHGTHCAGIIAADPKTNDPYSPQGIAPHVQIMPVKFLGAWGSGSFSDGIKAIKYAVENGANVLSNSWGGSMDDGSQEVELFKEILQYAQDNGVVVVAAAGNNGIDLDLKGDKVYIPGGISKYVDGVVTVASDNRGFPSSFSNTGEWQVQVAAPGSDIISTVIGNEWESLSGTSMATPIVAGLIARGISSNMNPYYAIQALFDTSNDEGEWFDLVQWGSVEPFEYLSK